MSKPNKSRQYTYRRLVDVKNGEPGIQNVFGVVKFFKKPSRTRGSDFSQVLSITDETLQDGDKLVVIQFYMSIKQFPSVSTGDIIRFHRLQVDLVNGELKGRSGPGFSWLYVHDDVDQPTASSANFSYTQQHKDRVVELMQWSRTQNFSQGRESLTSLKQLIPNQYCDVVCQVVSTCVESWGVCFVARVWDGTKCRYQVACTKKDMDKTDYGLEESAGDLTVDIWIYDNHFPHYDIIQPGQWVKFCNLHAAPYKGDQDKRKHQDCFVVPDLELTLHGGTSFGRRLDCLDPDSPEVTCIQRTLDSSIAERRQVSQTLLSQPSTKVVESMDVDVGHRKLTPTESLSHRSSSSSSSPQAGCSYWSDTRKRHSPSMSPVNVTSSDDVAPSKQTCRSGEEDKENSRVAMSSAGFCGERKGSDNALRVEQDNSVDSSCPDNELHCLLSSETSSGNDQRSVQGSTETCMLQTATVITGHQHISHTSLEAVLASHVPNKFRILAHLVDFHPDTLDPTQFLKLICPNCFHLKNPAEVSPTPDKRETSTAEGSSKPHSSVTRILESGFANWSPEEYTATDETCVCPNCTEADDPVPLELTYMLRLVLQDSRGHRLLANLWRQQAINFFQGIPPWTVLKDKAKLQDIVMMLRSMRLPQGLQSPSPPKLDCCVFSYMTSEGPNFHIFDTTLV